MSYRDWPTKLEGNQFDVAYLDPATAPEFEVKTWSNVFGKGGHVSVDAQVDGRWISLAKIVISEDRGVTEEREYLQDLLDEWNEAAAENWRRLVLEARASLRDYFERQTREYAQKLAELDALDVAKAV